MGRRPFGYFWAMSTRVRATVSGRFLPIAVLFALALMATGCTGAEETEAGEDVEDGSVIDDSSDATSTSDGSRDDTDDTGDGSEVSSSEEQARTALEDLVSNLAGADYSSASRFVINEGISDQVVDQLGINENDAYDPAKLDQALADYCDAVDCSRDVNIGPATTSDEFAVTFAVSVDQADASTETFEIPLSSFEGRFTVGLLPFGSIAETAAGNGNGSGDSETRTGDGVPYYRGEQSADGWRLAPIGTSDPLVTLWDADQVLSPGHTPGFSVIATGDFGELAATSDGIVFQESGSFIDGEAFDDTIWIEAVDGGPTALVSAPDGAELLLLEGARAIDLEEDVVYYQIRTGSVPEDTKSTLYSIETATGEITEIAVVGGWESGVDFHDISASYPLVSGMWHGEGFSGPVIIDFDTGDVLYHADQSGLSCFDGQAGCPAYWVVTSIDDVLYGLRPPDDAVDTQSAMSLHRFDPVTGSEVEITRFGWDTAVWLPRSIMAVPEGVIVSVEDGEGEPLPAVLVDLDSGNATTLSLAGYAAQIYLS